MIVDYIHMFQFAMIFGLSASKYSKKRVFRGWHMAFSKLLCNIDFVLSYRTF